MDFAGGTREGDLAMVQQIDMVGEMQSACGELIDKDERRLLFLECVGKSVSPNLNHASDVGRAGSRAIRTSAATCGSCACS